jgi:hypothetical protein
VKSTPSVCTIIEPTTTAAPAETDATRNQRGPIISPRTAAYTPPPTTPMSVPASNRFSVPAAVNRPMTKPSSLTTPVAAGFIAASSIIASRLSTPPIRRPSTAAAAVTAASRRSASTARDSTSAVDARIAHPPT